MKNIPSSSPGSIASKSGMYEIINQQGEKTGRLVSMVRGEVFPLTPIIGQRYLLLVKEFINDEPISTWFELSYASYMVLHRIILESMPIEWQKRFVSMLKEIKEEFNTDDVPTSFWVRATQDNKFIADPYKDYRRGTPPPRKNKKDIK
jgi:ferric iron reductase protein FhuF